MSSTDITKSAVEVASTKSGSTVDETNKMTSTKSGYTVDETKKLAPTNSGSTVSKTKKITRIASKFTMDEINKLLPTKSGSTVDKTNKMTSDKNNKTKGGSANNPVSISDGESTDNPTTVNSSSTPPKVKFFDLLEGYEDIEVDPANVPQCGPLRARPSKPHGLLQPSGTNMEWVGLLMGKPRDVYKRNKRKSREIWKTYERLGNDVFMRLKNDAQIQYVDSAGTIVAKSDIWFVHGFVEGEVQARLLATKSVWDATANEDKKVKQEKFQMDLKVWQQQFYDHLFAAGAVEAPSPIPTLKRKREERKEKIRQAKRYLEDFGYKVVWPEELEDGGDITMIQDKEAILVDEPLTFQGITGSIGLKDKDEDITMIQGKEITVVDGPLTHQALAGSVGSKDQENSMMIGEKKVIVLDGPLDTQATTNPIDFRSEDLEVQLFLNVVEKQLQEHLQEFSSTLDTMKELC